MSAIDPTGVKIGDRHIKAGTIIWGAGVQGSAAGRWLPVELDRAGRIPVEPDLSVRGLDGIYALGDTALAQDADGKPLPALAQVAQQQGTFLGRALAANLQRGAPIPPFKFSNRGNTAIVGRHSAIFDFGWLQFKGRLAWLLWAVVHIFLLVGFEKRILVSMQWLWQYITYQRGARLIMPERD